jgi:glycogen(starch) synthase
MHQFFPMTPKRILMTADTIGGVWTYGLELVRALAAYGIEVTLATMGARLNHGQAGEAYSLSNLEIMESNFKLEWMKEPWRDVALAGEWLLDIAERKQPDLVHLNGYAHAALRWQRPVLVVGHSCVLSWWAAVRKENAPAACKQYREAVTQGLQAADLVITPSQAMLDSLREHYGHPRAGLVIPKGRDPELFKPGRKGKFILSAGRLRDEAKNVTALAQVATDLQWPVRLAGEEQHPQGASSRYHNVQMLGRLSTREMASWFSRASIYALPAHYEPFGLSALEAGLAGCILVLEDIPSLREVWGDARNGKEMRRALRVLLNDSAMARELTNNGLATIRSRHTCAHRVDELLVICAEIQPSAKGAITLCDARQPALERLMLEPARSWSDGRFVVAGPQFPRKIKWPHNVKRTIHLSPGKHRAFYNGQKFTLNITRARMVEAGYSPSVRLFEAAACGTPIITDQWEGLDSFFRPGEEILVSHSPGQTLEYLRGLPESERRLIGNRARERVLAQHTARHRAITLESYIHELIRKQAIVA